MYESAAAARSLDRILKVIARRSGGASTALAYTVNLSRIYHSHLSIKHRFDGD